MNTVGRALSQLLHAIASTFRPKHIFKHPEDITWSSYIGFMREVNPTSKTWIHWETFVNWLFRDSNHCRNSYLEEKDVFIRK